MRPYYAKMRKKAFVTYFLIGIILIFVGAIIAIAPNQDVIDYLTASEEFYYVKAEDIRNDQYYASHNDFLIDWYCSDDEGVYYITTAESKYDGLSRYIGYYVYNKESELAERVCDQTYDYLVNENAEVLQEYLSGRGYVYDMEGQEKEYFKEYFLEWGFEESELEDMLVYKTFVLTPDSMVMNSINSDFWLMVCLGGILALVGLILMIMFLCGGFKASVRKKMKKLGIDEQTLAADLGEIPSGDDKMDIGRRYALLYDGGSTKLITLNQLVWVYMHTTITKHRIYGFIPCGTTKAYSVVMKMRDGSQDTVSAKSEENAQDIINRLHQRMPQIICGYSDQLASMFQYQRSEMIAQVDQNAASYSAYDGYGAYGAGSQDGTGSQNEYGAEGEKIIY